MINLLLIGHGTWGSKIYAALQQFGQVFTTVATRENWQQQLESKKYQGAIVATPPESHLEIALRVREFQIPLMLEKPAVLNLSDLNYLIDKKWNSPVLVNYIHLFSTKFQKLKNKYPPESIHHISSRGTNAGPIRSYSSLWDYGAHDLAMILDLLQEEPKNIFCDKSPPKFLQGELYNIILTFLRAKSFTLVGNGDSYRNRWLNINGQDFYDSYQEPPVLPNVLNTFFSLINGKEDYRSGWDLTYKITKILDTCQDI